MHPAFWPLVELRLTESDLELRPMTEADLAHLAAVLPEDLELDPSATRFAGLEPHVQRGVVQHQEYWRAYGTWRVESWRLQLVVRLAGQVVGVQALEGDEFVRLRTVDTYSWLVPGVRGQGIGRRMRTAVLALAFGPMAAEVAVTSAWADNDASLGVSRALGYQPNGEHRHARGDAVDRMVHLRLLRQDWLAACHGGDVRITGWDAAAALFGLPAAPS